MTDLLVCYDCMGDGCETCDDEGVLSPEHEYFSTPTNPKDVMERIYRDREEYRREQDQKSPSRYDGEGAQDGRERSLERDDLPSSPEESKQ